MKNNSILILIIYMLASYPTVWGGICPGTSLKEVNERILPSDGGINYISPPFCPGDGILVVEVQNFGVETYLGFLNYSVSGANSGAGGMFVIIPPFVTSGYGFPFSSLVEGATFFDVFLTPDPDIIDPDLSNNSGGALVYIEDSPPFASCQQDVIIELNEDGVAAIEVADIDAGSSDLCGFITDMSIVPVMVDCYEFPSDISVSLTVTDNTGQSSLCASQVQIVDNIPPILLAVPDDLTLSCDSGYPVPPNVSATDNCTAPAVVFVEESNQSSAGCGKYSYEIQRDWSAQDGTNITLGHQTITIIDEVAPVFINLPPALIFNVFPNCLAAVNLAAIAVDCAPQGEITITNNAPSGNGADNINGAYSPGVYPITFQATDPCGNNRTQTLTLIVVDNVAPLVTCLNTSVTLNANGQASVPLNSLYTQLSDNCNPGPFVSTSSPTNFNSSNLGANPVQITASDPSGNSNSCNAMVQVLPYNPPLATDLGIDLVTVPGCTSDNAVLTFKVFNVGDAVVPASAAQVVLDVSNSNTGVYNMVIGEELSPGDTVVLNLPGINLVNSGLTFFILGLTLPVDNNASNNTDGLGKNINATPNAVIQPAAHLCTNNLIPVTLNASGGTFYSWSAGGNSSSIQVTPSSTTTYTVTVTQNGCSDTTSLTVVVDPSPEPQLTTSDNSLCQGESATLSASGGGAGGAYLWNTGQNIAVISVTPPATSSFSVTVTNSFSCSATTAIQITVNGPPVALCMNDTVFLSAEGIAVTGPVFINAGSYDDCTGIGPPILSQQVFDCSESGVNIITLTITDGTGQTATCSANVVVIDTLPPQISCEQAIPFILNANGQVIVPPAMIINSIEDNCDLSPVVTANYPGSFGCDDIGVNSVIITATDEGGNTSSCNSIVTISESAASLICPASLDISIPPINSSAPIQQIAPVAVFGPCSDLLWQLTGTTTGSGINDASDQSFNLGVTQVSYSILDINGSITASCTFNIEVYHWAPELPDTIDPSFDCISFDGDFGQNMISAPFPVCVNSWRKDVWYVMQSNTLPVNVKVSGSPGMTPAIEVYTVSGPTVTYVDCNAATDPGGIATLEELNFNPALINYVRVYALESQPLTTWFTMYVYEKENECTIPLVIPRSGDHLAEKAYTDDAGWTHYIKEDSLLLFSISREGRFVGTVGDGEFEVSIHRGFDRIDLLESADPPSYLFSIVPGDPLHLVALESFWEVHVDQGLIEPGNDTFSVRSYFTRQEFDSLKSTVNPELQLTIPEEMVAYKINSFNSSGASLNPNPEGLHALVTNENITLYSNANPVTMEDPVWSLGLLDNEMQDGFIGMDIIQFSGGGIMGRTSSVGVFPRGHQDTQGIFIKPNPASTWFEAVLNNRCSGNGKWMIFDMLGNRLNPDRRIVLGATDHTFRVDISDLPAGAYYLSYYEDGVSHMAKLVKI